MLTVETEANGSTSEKGPSLVLADTRDFYPALAILVRQVQNIFFPHRTLFHFMCSHRPANWTGSRTGSPVLICVSDLEGVAGIQNECFRGESISQNLS